MQIRTAQFVKGINGTDEILNDGFPQIAFIGRSNVGKSSILNALTGQKDLVKVGKLPGKTRTINFFAINRELYFVDLPGYGYAKVGPEEKERIKKLLVWYFTYSGATPQMVALIVDSKVGLTDSDKEMLSVLREYKHRYVIIANKSDKLNPEALKQQLAAISAAAGGEEVLPYSALKKEGTEDILRRLLR